VRLSRQPWGSRWWNPRTLRLVRWAFS